MKRFLNNSSAFLLICLLLILLINLFQTHFNNEPPHYKLQYKEAVNTVSSFNGIILGNSQATHSIRPDLLDTNEIKFYNLALNGANPEFYSRWLENIFIPNHSRVKYWIITVDYSFLSGYGWRKFEQDSEYFPFSSFLKLLKQPEKYSREILITNRVPLLKYRSRLLKSFEKNQGAYEFLGDYNRGYISLKRNDQVDFNHRVKFKREISPEAKAKFLNFINHLSKLGDCIVFVIPPEYNLEANEYESLRDFLFSLSKKRNIPLYDFNNTTLKPVLNKVEYFTDLVHLNYRGSYILSGLLRKELYRDEQLKKCLFKAKN